MADAAVEFLLENLKQLLVDHVNLIKDVKDEVETLENDLRLFKAFLKDSTKKRRKDERLREFVRQIRDVVYEAEDTIDAFVTQANQATESKSKFVRRVFSSPVKLHDIARQVQKLSTKVKQSKIDFATLSVGDGDPEESEAPIIREKNLVGFEDEVAKIKGYLNEETDQLDVISIIGMPGLGKTTLAGKIFRDPNIQYEFPTRIWVYVSQEFRERDIFLAILKELITGLSEDVYCKTDHELAKQVATHLHNGKFLTVMDDVWTEADWDKLQIAFPISNKSCKVLITSPHVEVAHHANHIRPPHKLRFMTQEESWWLLQLEVFGKTECPEELDLTRKLIAKHYKSVPLAIVVIGGILVKKFSSSNEMSAKKSVWEKVSNSLSDYLREADPEKRMEKNIALSYDKLPFHLRACFLYLGMYPEDFEIPVWKLIRMWKAAGMVETLSLGKVNSSLEKQAKERTR